MKPKYPTKEEVLASLYEPSDEEINAVKQWKQRAYEKRWKNLKKLPRLEALMDLGDIMLSLGGIFSADMPNWVEGDKWAYYPQQKVVMLDGDNPSILSLLHEIGHVILGDSELKAQVYAVSMFKAAFPKEYARLEWDGHMLKTKKVS